MICDNCNAEKLDLCICDADKVIDFEEIERKKKAHDKYLNELFASWSYEGSSI